MQLEISPGVPNLLSSGTSLSSIDFQTSRTSPLGFAESQFGIPSPPSAISAKATAKIGAALDLYLAWEAALRSQVSAVPFCHTNKPAVTETSCAVWNLELNTRSRQVSEVFSAVPASPDQSGERRSSRGSRHSGTSTAEGKRHVGPKSVGGYVR